MGLKEFNAARKKLTQKLVSENYKGIIEYQPFFDSFWNQEPRIVVCNYEAFGYEGLVQPSRLTYEDFKWWFDERLNKSKKVGKSKTVHHSVLFIYLVSKLLKSYPDMKISVSDIKKYFRQYDDLYLNMMNVMYMNIRPTSASGNKQEIFNTNQIIEKTKNEMKLFLNSIEADIFIITTKNGTSLLNKILEENEKIKFENMVLINKTLYVSMKHFRMANYTKWLNTAKSIVETYLEKKLTTAST